MKRKEERAANWESFKSEMIRTKWMAENVFEKMIEFEEKSDQGSEEQNTYITCEEGSGRNCFTGDRKVFEGYLSMLDFICNIFFRTG